MHSRIQPDVFLVDAGENPGQAWSVLTALKERDARARTIVIVERPDLGRYPWHEMADEFVYPGAPETELEVRFAMLRHRAGSGDASIVTLGDVRIDTDTYKVTANGRPLDLTFKEFELLRHLATHPGRVYTRPALLREVWGYDFYGGTRTVDVHVRRLRAKLGPEHEDARSRPCGRWATELAPRTEPFGLPPGLPPHDLARRDQREMTPRGSARGSAPGPMSSP